jgi:flagellar motor component MotA
MLFVLGLSIVVGSVIGGYLGGGGHLSASSSRSSS